MTNSSRLGKRPLQFIWLAAIVALLGAMVLPISAAADHKPQHDKPNKGEVRGEGKDKSGNKHNVDGWFTVTNVVQGADGKLVAQGTFEGKVNGKKVTTEATAPINDAGTGDASVAQVPQDPADPGECNILFLVLGPLTLNLLGLEIEIPEPIIINIDADPSGGLLGQLLCGLLGPDGILSGLLDQLLGDLQGFLDFLNGLFGLFNPAPAP
jgi:hypothetical protein